MKESVAVLADDIIDTIRASMGERRWEGAESRVWYDPVLTWHGHPVVGKLGVFRPNEWRKHRILQRSWTENSPYARIFDMRLIGRESDGYLLGWIVQEKAPTATRGYYGLANPGYNEDRAGEMGWRRAPCSWSDDLFNWYQYDDHDGNTSVDGRWIDLGDIRIDGYRALPVPV